MKIVGVEPNNHRKAFEGRTPQHTYAFPYARLRLQPGARNAVVDAGPDPELGNKAFTYRLESGNEDTIHIDAVLEYNRDPTHLAELLVHRLTVQAQRALEESGLSKRELIRRLGTSPSQFYRLLDPAYPGKSVGQMLALLHIVGHDLEVVERPGT